MNMNQRIQIEKIEYLDHNEQLTPYRQQKQRVYIYEVNDNVEIKATPTGSGGKEWYIQVQAQSKSCLLVNLGQTNIKVELKDNLNGSESKDTGDILPSHTSKQIPYGQRVRVNNRTLIFHRKRTSPSIEVDFSIPETQLTESNTETMPLRGKVTLYNKGPARNVQFRISKVEGVEDSCFNIVSPPKLLGGASQESTQFTLFHPHNQPIPSGHCCIGIYVTADEYPDEEAADFQEVYIQPFYKYELMFEDEAVADAVEEEKSEQVVEEEKPKSEERQLKTPSQPDDLTPSLPASETKVPSEASVFGPSNNNLKEELNTHQSPVEKSKSSSSDPFGG